jgi:hypothetical protein
MCVGLGWDGLSLSCVLLPGRSSVGSGGGDPWTMEEESECAKLCNGAMKYYCDARKRE